MNTDLWISLSCLQNYEQPASIHSQIVEIDYMEMEIYFIKKEFSAVLYMNTPKS